MIDELKQYDFEILSTNLPEEQGRSCARPSPKSSTGAMSMQSG